MNEFSLRLDVLSYSKLHVPYDFGIFFYKGAAALTRRESYTRFQLGKLGVAIPSRGPLLVRLHEFFSGEIVGGTSESTIRSHFAGLRLFFSYIDHNDLFVEIDNVVEHYIEWGNSVSEQCERGEIAHSTAMGRISNVGVCIASVCDVSSYALTTQCRLKPAKNGVKSPSGSKYFSHAEVYCRDIEEIIGCLPVSSLESDLPILITTTQSDYDYYSFGGLKSRVVLPKGDIPDGVLSHKGNNWSLRVLINLRMICEAVLFVRWSASNFEQLRFLKYSERRMTYSANGVKFFAYKKRKGGEVSYSISAEYSKLYSNYLEFRRFVVERFPSDLLFPFVRIGRENQRDGIQDRNLRVLMEVLERPYVPPAALRKFQLNKVLQSTGDPRNAIFLGQHSSRTFFRSYYSPNHSVSAREWAEFWLSVDAERKAALAAGECAGGTPALIDSQNSLGPNPDCTNPAGCLFCAHYRGVESLDYIWSLLSYKKLKSIEYSVSKFSAVTKVITPLEMIISRISEIEDQFKLKSIECSRLCAEASLRVAEGVLHPDWSGFIELFEGG